MTEKENIPSFKLPSSVTIGDVEGIYAELAKLNGNISIDATGVEAITTPGVQLLISLSKKVENEGGKFTLSEPSKSCAQAFEVLGLQQQLTKWSA